MADLMPIGNKDNPPPLIGTTPAVLGPLPGSQPQVPFLGQLPGTQPQVPAPDSHLPGVQPYFDMLFQSFVRNATPEQLLDEERMDLIMRKCLSLAIKIIKNFPQMKASFPLK